MSRPRGRWLLGAVLAGACVMASACATRQTRALMDVGIPRCPIGAEKNLLSSDALQCWFAASHGRWRTLNHQSHLEALVVEIEAGDLRDAVEIAQRVVEDPGARPFTEILVYVARPDGGQLHIRRVGWTRRTGLETLDFSSPLADTPLTVRSSPGRQGAGRPHPQP